MDENTKVANAMNELKRCLDIYRENKSVSIDLIANFEFALLELSTTIATSRYEANRAKANMKFDAIELWQNIKDWRKWDKEPTEAHIKRTIDEVKAVERKRLEIQEAHCEMYEAVVKAYIRWWNTMSSQNIQRNVDNKRWVAEMNWSEKEQSHMDLMIDEMKVDSEE